MRGGLELHGVKERPTSYKGLPADFTLRYSRILSAHTPRDAADCLAAAITAETGARTVTVVSYRNGEGTIEYNYIDGAPWQYRIGRTIPDYALSSFVYTEQRPLFWSVNKVDHPHPEWFLVPYHIGVPIRSQENPEEVIGTIIIGCEAEASYVDATAMLAEFVGCAYAMVLDRVQRYGRGIEAGREIAYERMVQRLHDTVAQDIFVCECEMHELKEGAQVQQGPLSEKLGRVAQRLSRCNGELRAALADARSSAVGKSESLSCLVRRLVADHESKGGASVITVLGGNTDNPEAFDSSLLDVVEGVLTESLANVRKHASADNAIVSCNAERGFLSLTVQDDGIGLKDREAGRPEPDSPPMHFGISNMRVLAQKAGGKLDVTNVQGETGTCVRLRLPIKEETDGTAQR